ncbi:hypothetical protein CAPTEDRAFT_210232, partial [Capitella teleta]
MGSDMKPGPADEAPTILITALKDPGIYGHPGTDLQRLQVIKGWVDENGKTHEKVIDIAGNPDNGATVNKNTCEPEGQGYTSLCGVWQDPEFDPEQPAFYYARVVENPSCRWSTLQCKSYGVDPFSPQCEAQAAEQTENMDDFGDIFGRCCIDPETEPFYSPTIQERAWTSPVWYTPEGKASMKTASTERRLLLSPLMHCLWLGMTLLWVTAEPEPAPVITISEQQIKDLQVQWQLQTGRVPDARRTNMLIEASIENEILFQEAMNRRFDQLPVVKTRLQQLGGFLKLTNGDASDREREALKLGLDKTDPLIRRYLISAMQEVIAAESPAKTADKATLEAYYRDNKEQYRQPAVASISHVFFGGFEQQALDRANELLSDIPTRPDDAVKSGDPFFNGHQLPSLNEQQLSKKLGSEFASHVMTLEA